MDLLLYLAVAFSVLVSLYSLLAIRSLRRQISDTKDSITSQISWAKEDLRNDMNGIRTVLRVLSDGGRVTRDMVDEGKPYSDISAVEAEALLRGGKSAAVIDVRTPSEYLAGHIPGSKLIPVDEIEQRVSEVPRNTDALLLVCQGGGRSAAACEILSKFGFVNLINIADGMGAWPAKKEIGVAIRPPASAPANG
jgi:rhodanese-related sulfurtransferase